MKKYQKRIGAFSADLLLRVVDICSQQPDVKTEVMKNHDDNLWWPLSVSDWRLRMVIAGWSTRISYKHINTYSAIVQRVNTIGFDALTHMSDTQVETIIQPLGLKKTRIAYLRSMQNFIDKHDKPLVDYENNELINLIYENVEGAGYKVAQCAALYAKGYDCGIFPVDTGMQEMLGRCLGLYLTGEAKSHEMMRLTLEQIIEEYAEDFYKIAIKNGYGSLALPTNKAPVWWVHLVLIYFKRAFCNLHKPIQCPLKATFPVNKYIGNMCSKENPTQGGYNYIILEGVDKSGKTTLSSTLSELVYIRWHSVYRPNHDDIYLYYKQVIDEIDTPVVFDRSFISEMVYGPVLRGHNRLSDDACNDLLQMLAAKGSIVFYVSAPFEVIRSRILQANDLDKTLITHLPTLVQQYEFVMQRVSHVLPTHKIDLSNINEKDILSHVYQIVGLLK